MNELWLPLENYVGSQQAYVLQKSLTWSDLNPLQTLNFSTMSTRNPESEE